MRRWLLPPQHGAWAMLVVPYLAVGYRWPDPPVLGAWLAGYLLSYYVFQALKSRKPRRYRAQLVTYGGIAAALAATVVVVSRPAVLSYAPVYAALNVWYAIRRQERALTNDLAPVVRSSLIVLGVAGVAGRPESPMRSQAARARGCCRSAAGPRNGSDGRDRQLRALLACVAVR